VDGERPLEVPLYNLEFSSWKSVPSALSTLLSDFNVLKAFQRNKSKNLRRN
jgi:hypothetical protein